MTKYCTLDFDDLTSQNILDTFFNIYETLTYTLKQRITFLVCLGIFTRVVVSDCREKLPSNCRNVSKEREKHHNAEIEKMQISSALFHCSV